VSKKVWHCSRCSREFPLTKIKALIYSRELCPKCYDAWRAWQATSFRVFMCDTLPQSPPPPDPVDPNDESGVFGFVFPSPGDEPATDPDIEAGEG
jgi:hypothetical protein